MKLTIDERALLEDIRWYAALSEKDAAIVHGLDLADAHLANRGTQ